MGYAEDGGGRLTLPVGRVLRDCDILDEDVVCADLRDGVVPNGDSAPLCMLCMNETSRSQSMLHTSTNTKALIDLGMLAVDIFLRPVRATLATQDMEVASRRACCLIYSMVELLATSISVNSDRCRIIPTRRFVSQPLRGLYALTLRNARRGEEELLLVDYEMVHRRGQWEHIPRQTATTTTENRSQWSI